MNRLAMVVALLVLVVGVLGITAPDNLVTIGRYVVTPTGLYLVAALRVSIGLMLMLAAEKSRMRRTVRVLGGFILIAGITTPIFGVDRSRVVFDWWASQGPLIIRVPAVSAAAFGAFLIYAIGSGRTRAFRPMEP